MAITSVGTASGLGLEDLLTKILDAESKPAVERFKLDETTITAKISALGAIRRFAADGGQRIADLAGGFQHAVLRVGGDARAGHLVEHQRHARLRHAGDARHVGHGRPAAPFLAAAAVVNVSRHSSAFSGGPPGIPVQPGHKFPLDC